MIELHCHTTASDGTLSPEELVRLALARGLTALAITDHDTTEAFSPAREAARGYRLEVIPAVEINTQKAGREVHILGYYIAPDDPGLAASFREVRRWRLARLEAMVERLGRLGMPVELSRVLAGATGTVGRPHLARVLVEDGLVPDIQTAFDLYLAQSRPAYVPRQDLSPERAIELIRAAGGVAVAAHPGLVGDDALLEELVEAGLQGVEAYYPQHGPLEVQRYAQFALRRGLLVTGGSDFHGPEARYRVQLGEMALPPGVLERLKEAAGR
ncbi:MAG TPA: PHP domain-containing protein [Candidatus Nitrosotenuis sp.]|nr:PHP domain-containing protein [Candidatus Nitrosotenuis sp.]